MTSTELGIAIDVKPLPPNVVSTTRDNLYSLENVTDAMDAHLAKQAASMISTEAGIVINVKPLSRKASLSSGVSATDPKTTD
jgi:hypothetical protein